MSSPPGTVVAVGTFTPALYLFSVSSLGKISPLGITTSFVPDQEPLLMVPDPACDTEVNLVASNNNCACHGVSDAANGGPVYGISALGCCSEADVGIVTARLGASGQLRMVSRVPQPGLGPIHMAYHQSGKIAMANYVGGNADLVGPFDPTTATLGTDAWSSVPLDSNVSLMHMVSGRKRSNLAAATHLQATADRAAGSACARAHRRSTATRGAGAPPISWAPTPTTTRS